MPKVLVVDDDTSIRDVLRLVLEDEGYTVEQAPDGAVALDTLRASPAPMVVLLDLMMPRVTGYQVLETAAADPALAGRHAFIVVTAGSPTGPGASSIAERAVPVLRKPFDLDAVLLHVSAAAARLPPQDPVLAARPHARPETCLWAAS